MEFKKLVREPAQLFLMILFPAILTLSFGLAFGSIETGEQKYDLCIINLNESGRYPGWSEEFVTNIAQTGVFSFKNYTDQETAQLDLVQGFLDAILIIPEDFGVSCRSLYYSSNKDKWIRTEVELYVDQGDQFARAVIPPVIEQALIETMLTLTDADTSVDLPVSIGSPELVESKNLSQFDYMAPGLFAMAGIYIIMSLAQSFTDEREQGLLKRINTTPTSSGEFIGSHIISNMLVAVIQVVVVLGLAYVVGYRPLGGVIGVILAFILMIIFSLCSIGLGLVTAAISKSPGAATGISFAFIMPQMFFGTFISMGEFSRIVGMFLPSYYVTDALTSIFLRGAIEQSIYQTLIIDFVVISIVSVVILLLGVWLYKKYGSDQ